MHSHALNEWTSDDIVVINDERFDLDSLILAHKNSNDPNIKATLQRSNTLERKKNEAYMHSHLDFVELVYIKEGEGIATVGLKEYPIKQGDIIVVPMQQPHNNFPLPHLCIINLLVSVSLLEKNFSIFQGALNKKGALCFPTIVHLSEKDRSYAENIFEGLRKENLNHELYYNEAMIYNFNLFLIMLCRCMNEVSISKNKSALEETIEYIHKHYDTVTLSEAAAIGHYSASYFCRLFRKEFGQNFTEYVNKLRINRSVALLCNTSLSAEAICVSVGFKSKIHFYDVFRKHIGVTPGEFRRSQK